MIDSDQFAGYLALIEKADNTIRAYRALFVRWVDWAIVHDRDPWHPDPLAARAWAAQLDGSRSTLAQARAMVGHLCRVLGVDDVSTAIPVPRKPRGQDRGLEHDAAVRFARQAKVSGHRGTAVLVALYSAARRSEIASLAWSRIMWDANLMTLQRPKQRDLHTVPLHPALKAHLLERHLPDERWVFPGRWGGHVSPATIGNWIDHVARAAGIGHVTPHQLRHTSLTEAYDATGDLRAVQDLAGHTDPAVTARYTRTSRRRLEAAVGALNFD